MIKSTVKSLLKEVPKDDMKLIVQYENGNGITTRQFQCLQPCAWLNDTIINARLKDLSLHHDAFRAKHARAYRRNKNVIPFVPLKCKLFNTFFYSLVCYQLRIENKTFMKLVDEKERVYIRSC